MAVGYITKQIKSLPTGEDKPSSGYVRRPRFCAAWPAVKIAQFEKDIISQKMSLKALSDHYKVSINTITNYRDKVLGLALKIAKSEEQSDIATQAREHFSFVLDEIKDSMDEIKGRKKDKHGKPIVGNVAVHGNVIALLGMGLKAIELATPPQPKATSGDPTNPQVSTVVNVISLPKAPGVPERGKAIASAVDYSNIKIHDVEPEEA